MKVIEKATMSNGTKIQLEDWSEHNTDEFPDLYGFTIGAYPIARNSSKHKFVENGNVFRLSISRNKYTEYTNDDVKADFEALKQGFISLEDLSKHFDNGRKDMFYLGVVSSEY